MQQENNISFDELKRYYDDLSDNYSILQEKFGAEMQRNDVLNTKLCRAVNQYNAVVQQNKDLQKELKEKCLQIAWNAVNDVNYGEFILKRHSWCSFLNTTDAVGFIDVEYIKDKRRRVYVGIGKGYDFNEDVLNIAKYGTCIMDLGYAE